MECSFAAADAACDEAGVHAVLRPQYGALYNVPVLREPCVFIFQRVKLPGDDVADGQRAYLYKSKRSEVPVPVLEECTGINKLWPDPGGVFSFLCAG